MIDVNKTTKGYSNQSGNSPLFEPKRYGPKSLVLSEIATIPEANIADISLHELIRHQNHRSIKISPVPAPKVSKISNI
jgi:hypothetical protein